MADRCLRGLRLSFALLLVIGPGACASTRVEPVSPIAEIWAGCYTLALGPWLAPSGEMLDSAQLDAPSFVPPSMIQLHARESQVPLYGHWELLPQPGPDELFRFGSWRGNADSLILEWSTGGSLGSPLFLVALHRGSGNQYVGRAFTETDYIIPRPYRTVAAAKIECRH